MRRLPMSQGPVELLFVAAHMWPSGTVSGASQDVGSHSDNPCRATSVVTLWILAACVTIRPQGWGGVTQGQAAQKNINCTAKTRENTPKAMQI